MTAAYRLLLPALALLLADLSAAGDIQSLLRGGHLEVRSSLVPGSGSVPGQKLTLVLETATDTWFTGGTRISIPEVPGLIILQTEQFATNASESRAGITWVVQRWSLDLYPQRAGAFTVGPIALEVQVNAGAEGTARGEVLAPAVSFSVALPEALKQAQFWVAAPAFTATQSFDRELGGLIPGDAFERTVRFQASEVLAMMLPTFTEPDLEGLAAYPAPPQLANSSNRGEARALRTQTVSYVAEAPGKYLLPAQDFFWWDTREGELRVVTLMATEVLVEGDEVAKRQRAEPVLNPRQWAVLAASALLVLAVAALLWRFRPHRGPGPLPAPLLRLWRQLLELRKPALPSRLNPGNNAGE